jgi:probable HAF family extracellular repeat protein
MKRVIRTNRYRLESLEARRLLTTYVVDLGMLPGGITSYPWDINASGQVVGGVDMGNGTSRAFIWRNGVMSDLGTLGGTSGVALGINDAGQVVGQVNNGSAAGRAFLVTPEDTDGNGAPDRWFRDSNADGKNDLMRDLGTIGGSYIYALARDVNNLGQVVGTVSTNYWPARHAFRWQNGVMTDMGTFGGEGSDANAINDAGQITGSVLFSTGPVTQRGFLWNAGVVTDLGNTSSGPTDINASGRIVDQLDPNARIWTPTAPNGSSGTFAGLGQLPPLAPDASSSAAGINAAGQVVGTQADFYFDGENRYPIAYRGIRWINGAPQELPLDSASGINDAGYIVGRRGERAILLTDENFAMPLVTIANTSVTEGNSGSTNALFTVSLSKASTQTITVRCATADGTATAGSDYLAAAATLTFAPGQTSRTFSVSVLGDRIADYGETFMVALSNPSNAVVAGPAATGTIQDDEPRVSAPAVTVLEGNTGSTTAVVTVNLSSAYDQPITLTYTSKDDTAKAGSDYVATSGTLTFAPGQTTKQIAVSILGDRVAEFTYTYIDETDVSRIDSEYLSLAFTNPGGNATVIGAGSVGIQEDEPRVVISPHYLVVTEPASGTIDALFTVSLLAAYDQDVIVEYSAFDGAYEGLTPASGGSDYVNTFGSLRIPAGQTSRTIAVPIIGDGVDEDTEYFQVILMGSSGNASIEPLAGFGIGEIRDYDGTVKTWIGPASGGNWSTASNWSPSGVPTASDVVAISGKSVNVTASAPFGSIALAAGANLKFAYTGVSPIGSWDGSAYTGVSGMIQSGRIAASPSSRLIAVGIAEAPGHVLVKFTYGGDANLDGTLNIDDYTRIDSGVSAGLSGWSNGDFNYDGKINIDDYVVIDGNIGTQGPPFSNGASTRDADVLSIVRQPTRSWSGSAERDDEWADLLRPAD